MASIVKSNSPESERVIAAFDLGSNSIKMTVAREGASPKEIEEFLWRSETVRLGSGVDQTGSLAPDRIEAALETLHRFSTEARSVGATRLVGVATEATRVAANGQAFLDRVTRELGIELRSISGDREANLTFIGLQGVVDLRGAVVVADIGGGSTELVTAVKEEVKWSKSFPLGSGRLTERFISTDPPEALELEACREFARSLIDEAPLHDSIGGRLIVVGGTGEYMNRLIPDDSDRAPAELERVLGRLTTITAADLASLIDIPLARAKVLPAGVAISAAVADLMKPVRFEAAQSGIRRGLLLAAFAGEV